MSKIIENMNNDPSRKERLEALGEPKSPPMIDIVVVSWKKYNENSHRILIDKAMTRMNNDFLNGLKEFEWLAKHEVSLWAYVPKVFMNSLLVNKAGTAAFISVPKNMLISWIKNLYEYKNSQEDFGSVEDK